MTRLRTRLGWALPILVLAVLAVILSTLVGTAGGATTVLATSSTSLPASALPEGVATTSEATGSASTQIFEITASELGTFGSAAPSISSPAAVVVNMSTGRVLYSKKADVRRPMASTTKIMTAILCLESLPLDREVTISAKAAQTSEVKSFLKEGDVLTVEQLLYSLLVHSSNSSAVALAEAAAGSTDAFVERMNAKAAQLGMEDTAFVNPNGLDADGHYSTPDDMAKLGLYAMKNAMFRKLVSTKYYTLEIPARDKSLTFENTNKLMVRADWVTGVKTGLTPRADQCLVATGTKNGVSTLIVILGQPSTSVCWDESEALLNYGFSQYKHVQVLDEGVAVAEASVPYHVDGAVSLKTDGSLEMDVYKEDDVKASVEIDRALALPVQAGDTFGRLVLTIDGEPVGLWISLRIDRTRRSHWPRRSTTRGTVSRAGWEEYFRPMGGIRQ